MRKLLITLNSKGCTMRKLLIALTLAFAVIGGVAVYASGQPAYACQISNCA